MSLLYNRKDISKEEFDAWDKLDMDKELREAVNKVRISRKFPRTQTAAGNMKGVSFLLLHDVLKKYKCPSASSSGFMVRKYLSVILHAGKCRALCDKVQILCIFNPQVAVHHPLEEPQIERDGVAIPPGHEVFIKVTGEVTIADPGLEALPPVS